MNNQTTESITEIRYEYIKSNFYFFVSNIILIFTYPCIYALKLYINKFMDINNTYIPYYIIDIIDENEIDMYNYINYFIKKIVDLVIYMKINYDKEVTLMFMITISFQIIYLIAKYIKHEKEIDEILVKEAGADKVVNNEENTKELEDNRKKYTFALSKAARSSGADKYVCIEQDDFSIYIPQNISRESSNIKQNITIILQ